MPQARIFTIYHPWLMTVDVGCGSACRVGNGSGTVTNYGTIRVIGGANVSPGMVYSPFIAGGFAGTGACQAIGGTWSALSHQFTASPVQCGNSGQQLNIDLASIQHVLIDDDATGWDFGASFLCKDSSTPLNFTATAINGGTLTALHDHLYPGNVVLGGWQFEADSGYTPGESAYLSFDIGTEYSRDDLTVWHYDGSSWTPYDATDLTCNGGWASFTVTGFSGYAVTTPEPSTIALLLAGAACLLALAWRRRRR